MTFLQWYCTGFVFFWIAVFLKQVFYWYKDGHVRIAFNALVDGKDWREACILSLLLATLGLAGLFLVWYSVRDIYDEHKHQIWCENKRKEET